MAGLRKTLGILVVILLLCPALAGCASPPFTIDFTIDIISHESGDEVTRSPITISGLAQTLELPLP